MRANPRIRSCGQETLTFLRKLQCGKVAWQKVLWEFCSEPPAAVLVRIGDIREFHVPYSKIRTPCVVPICYACSISYNSHPISFTYSAEGHAPQVMYSPLVPVDKSCHSHGTRMQKSVSFFSRHSMTSIRTERMDGLIRNQSSALIEIRACL